MVVDMIPGGNRFNGLTVFRHRHGQRLVVLIRVDEFTSHNAPLGQVFRQPDTVGGGCGEANLVDLEPWCHAVNDGSGALGRGFAAAGIRPDSKHQFVLDAHFADVGQPHGVATGQDAPLKNIAEGANPGPEGVSGRARGQPDLVTAHGLPLLGPPVAQVKLQSLTSVHTQFGVMTVERAAVDVLPELINQFHGGGFLVVPSGFRVLF